MELINMKLFLLTVLVGIPFLCQKPAQACLENVVGTTLNHQHTYNGTTFSGGLRITDAGINDNGIGYLKGKFYIGNDTRSNNTVYIFGSSNGDIVMKRYLSDGRVQWWRGGSCRGSIIRGNRGDVQNWSIDD